MNLFVILGVTIALWFAVVVQGQVMICRPNSVFMVDCNVCKCNAYGTQETCTQMRCHKRPTGVYEILGPSPGYANTKRSNTGCVPGNHWYEDCNVCWCTEDGKHVGCTATNCDKNGSVKSFILLKKFAE